MAAIDADYWNKCVSKVMKEAKLYIEYDGIGETTDDNSSENFDTHSQVSLLEEGNGERSATEDEVLTSKASEVATISKLNAKSQFKALKAVVVKQCTEELISPSELSTMYGKSKRTIQHWVTMSGATLPHKYRKRTTEFSIPITSDPSCSTSSSDTTFGDHSYTRTDFRLSAAKEPESASNSTAVIASKTPVTLRCPKCSFETSRKNSLDKHIKSHTSCKYCDQMFAGKILLDAHLKTHKPKKAEKQYFCDFCGKDCKSRVTKWRHMKICERKK